MSDGLKIILSALVVLFVFMSCSSDPEGPVTEKFLKDGYYRVRPGETRLVKIPVTAVNLPVPVATGVRPLLGLGRIKGIEYTAVLFKFDFSVTEKYLGKEIFKAYLDIPVRLVSPDSNFSVVFRMYELNEGFSEDDTIITVPEHQSEPIVDDVGIADRTIGLEKTTFSIDRACVSSWIETGGERSIALIFQSQNEPSGIIEFNAHELGTDPPVIKVEFSDTSDTIFAVKEDYNIIQLKDTALTCVGGVANRVLFRFSLDSINDSAMVHASFLILNIDGEGGLGATPGDEVIMGAGSSFYYYLYTPDSEDTLSEGILRGTGVDRGTIDVTESSTIKLNLRGFIPDIIRGARVNTGLVLQSDLELLRVQKAVIKNDSTSAPYLEVIYSMPGEFGEPDE